MKDTCLERRQHEKDARGCVCKLRNMEAKKYKKGGKRVGQQYETPRTSLEKSRATAVVHFLKKNFILQFCFPAK